MSKRNTVSYIKPADPKFLQQLKAQIGYSSGPTLDTKRQKLDGDSDSDRSDYEDEAPQVVVVKKGDLTAEEAEAEQKRIETEENEKPADLSQRIVFKSKKLENSTSSTTTNITTSTTTTTTTTGQTKLDKKDKKRPSKPEVSKSKLSFQIDDEEEEEEEDE